MRNSAVAATLASLALLSIPGTAFAHAKLMSSTPSANSVVPGANARSINLVFNERVIASTMKVDLVMTAMPGTRDHPPMKVAFSSMMGKDGKSIMLMPRRALAPGTYQVTWSAAGADTHRMGSQFVFTVR